MTLLIISFYFIACFATPSIYLYLKTNINPITFKNSESAHDLIGFYMKILIFFCFISGIEEQYYSQIQLLFIFNNSNSKYFGYILCAISIIWTTIAQIQMSQSWRIGIDTNIKTELKKFGLFSISRNPIFLGMLTAFLSLFFIRPTTLNLLILIVSYILISIQIRLEESFLLTQHGKKYEFYKNNTPRWL